MKRVLVLVFLVSCAPKEELVVCKKISVSQNGDTRWECSLDGMGISFTQQTRKEREKVLDYCRQELGLE